MRFGEFITSLEATPWPDGKNWRLDDALVWRWADGSVEAVPYGFVTDFASVPDLSFFAGLLAVLGYVMPISWLFWPTIIICIFAKWIDDDQNTDAGAAFHDLDYTRKVKPRWRCDWHLWIRMMANRRTSGNALVDYLHFMACLLKSSLYWFNLRLFGWIAWRRG